MQPQPSRIDALQAGRALAALAVVALHANLYERASPLFDYGGYGVDFFFLLSGFIIYRSHAASFVLKDYAERRLTRVFVPYLPVAIVIALAYTIAGRSDWSWLATLTLAPDAARPSLTVAWTLQREVAFYILAGLFFATRKPLVCASIWGAAILAFAVTDATLTPAGVVVFGLQNMEFVAGMFLARATQGMRLDRIPTARPLVFMGNASYAIYLVHLPAMGLLWRAGASFPLLLVGSIAAGIVYHLAWERPMLAVTHRSLRRLSKSPAFLLLRRPIRPFRQQSEIG